MNMRHLLPLVVTSLLVLSACEDKSMVEKARDKVNDALDRRPAENVRDAAEDATAAAKDLGEAVKSAAADAAQEAKEAAKDVKESVHDATR
jgi:methyl-accepting chemotaxis protein